jgi:apolipoprotein N-acyltransferase
MRFDAFEKDVREAAAQGTKIIFTSEMMFNFDPQVEFTEEFRALAAETDTYIFIDYTTSIEGQEWRNESILLNPSGEFSAVYGKNEIPPGEPYTPTAGVYPVFDTPLGKLATMICHDANYTDTARKLAANGAQLVSSGINEFGGFGEQYWTNVSFRAIENRTAMVVTSRETGSAIINADGSLVALDLEMGKHVVLVGDVTLGSGNAPYTSLGDILGWVSMIAFIGFMVYQSMVEKRAKKAAQS